MRGIICQLWPMMVLGTTNFNTPCSGVSIRFFCHFHVSSTKVTKSNDQINLENLLRKRGPSIPAPKSPDWGKKAPMSPRKSQLSLDDTFQEKKPTLFVSYKQNRFANMSWFKLSLQVYPGCLNLFSRNRRFYCLITALKLLLCKSECLKGPQIPSCKVASLKSKHSNFPLTTSLVI